LEEIMATTNQYQSNFARKYIEQGEARGEARALLMLLRELGVSVTDEVRDRTMGCTDVQQLEQWIGRVKSITSADELFA
jgi:hypothetical protein